MNTLMIRVIFALAVSMLSTAGMAQDEPPQNERQRGAQGERRKRVESDRDRRGGNENRDGRAQDRRGQEQRGQGQRGSRRGGDRRGGGQGGGTGAIFRLLDTDQDGQLSANEIGNAVAVLKKLDKNNDGILSAEELSIEGRGRGRGGQGATNGAARTPKVEIDGDPATDRDKAAIAVVPSRTTTVRNAPTRNNST